jgi:hypothetical protein
MRHVFEINYHTVPYHKIFDYSTYEKIITKRGKIGNEGQANQGSNVEGTSGVAVSFQIWVKHI